jgi:hypothetical protein
MTTGPDPVIVVRHLAHQIQALLRQLVDDPELPGSQFLQVTGGLILAS